MKDRPFRCTQCPKSFTRKDLLSRHDRLSHRSKTASDTLSAAGLPIPYSSRHPLTSINGLLNPPTEHSSTLPDLNQNSTAQDTNGSLNAPSGTADDLPIAAEVSKSYNDNIASQDSYAHQQLNFSLESHDDSEYFAIGPMDDFTSFMDSVSVPTHPFSPTYQPVPLLFQVPGPPFLPCSNGGLPSSSLSSNEGPVEPMSQKSATVMPTTKDSNSSFSQIVSQLPSLHPEGYRPADSTPPPKDLHLHISADCRQRIINDLEGFNNCVDEDFTLPSRHVLARFFGGYFSSFHDHFPFLHVPSLRPEKISAELFIAIAAVGARYTHELNISIDLFNVAKALALERIRRHKATCRIAAAEKIFQKPPSSSMQLEESIHRRDTGFFRDKQQNTIQILETVLLLVAITTWSEPGSASDALSMRSMLDCLIREEEGLRVHQEPYDNWESWIRYEKIKRILFVAFCFLNMHTIVFDLPPIMWANEVDVDLPSCEKEWRAQSEEEWESIRKTVAHADPNFRDAFRGLFCGITEAHERLKVNHSSFSSLGGCALIHALIQQIWLIRNVRLPLQRPEDRLPADQMSAFENALRNWAILWEQNKESSMDPLSPYGPIAFTSTALMRLAYIRLNMNLGPIRYLSSWNPRLIAESLHASPSIQRSERVTQAALHCAHALSIPVKLGLSYIAETQVRFWSNQHALCSLECALLLSKWLECVTVKDPIPPLTQAEARLLEFVAQLVAETEYRVGSGKLNKRNVFLSVQTVRLWARLYQCKSVWEVVTLIGASLNIYADLLEQDYLLA
ncbi:fungal-specific transcription factor domain-containing protein [Trichoderma sp. SZMC 28014]